MSKTKSYKANLDKIRVTFPNGDFIEEDVVVNTFAETIKCIGVDRVYGLKIWGNKKHKILLVENRQIHDATYERSQMELIPGYYLHTYNNTETKARYLKQISDALHENLKVEIIKNHVKSSTPISSPTPQPILPTKPVTIQKKIVGQVEKADGVWRYKYW